MEGNLLSSSGRNKLILDDVNETVRFVREQQPEHCIMKVDCFSVLEDALSKSKRDHLDSTEFKAGGYTWVLSVYPKGNEKEDGAAHLSLYVALVDKLSSGSFINVALRFFVYDQIRDNYLTLDIRDKRFHALKSAWGISKFLPHESFTDAANGFVVNDCCVSGAEVFVRDGPIKRSSVSLLEAKSDRSYTWRIENFFYLDNYRLLSPTFCFGEWSWNLSLYPRGKGKAKGKHLSLFLRLVHPNNLIHGSKLYASYTLRIRNQCGGANYQKIANAWFSSDTINWGFSSLISISRLHSASKGLIVDDTLIVEVKIEEMLHLKEMEI